MPRKLSHITWMVLIPALLWGCSLPDAAESEATAATAGVSEEAQPNSVPEKKELQNKPPAPVPVPAPIDPLKAFRTSRANARSASLGVLGARWRLGMNGLPRNSRQVGEGYWIGAHPTPENIEELHARGVNIILSGTYLDQETRDVCDELGMRHVDVPFGGTFPNATAILQGIGNAAPNEIYIHCQHGGDRSGAMLAFLLSVRHHWAPDHALLAVAFPAPGDLRRLSKALESRGVDVTPEEEEQYAGIYSAERNGGFGGLKVRGPSYEKLVRTTVEAMASQGVPLE